MSAARTMRLICAANSVSVMTTTSGAASVVAEEIDPESRPSRKPASDATRADSASYTLAGETHSNPWRMARAYSRRSVWRRGDSPVFEWIRFRYGERYGNG